MNRNLLEKVQESYRRLTRLLIKKNITVSTMESCTSGLIASLITDTEGASAVFPGACVTYSNEWKTENGVDPGLILKYSVYSTQVAESMAKSAAEKFRTQIGIGVTGCFGNPDPCNPEGIPGTVCYAVCCGEKMQSGKLHVSEGSSRAKAKLEVAEKVAEVLFLLAEEVTE